MVQIDIKVEGQRGHMIIQDDGTIVGSTGELSSSEATSHHITNLMTHSLPVDFNALKRVSNGSGDASASGQGHVNSTAQDDNGTAVSKQPVNGALASGDDSGKTIKWNRITVRFPEQSFVACLSNRKIHVVKRDNDIHLSEPAEENSVQTPS